MAQTILELIVIKLATREQWQSLEEISQRLESLTAHQGPAAASTVSLALDTTRLPATADVPTRPVAASAADAPAAPTRAVTASAADVPAADLTAMVVPDTIQAQWPTFLTQLGEKKISLAAYLADSAPLGFTDGVLTVGLPGFALHQEVLTLAGNCRLIEELLSTLYATKIRVEYTTRPTPPESESPQPVEVEEPASPIVQEIVSLFDATVLDRKPRTT